MSDEAAHDGDPVTDLATAKQINQIGFSLLALTILLLYLLITTWPVLTEVTINGVRIKKFEKFNLFGMWCDWAVDKRVLFTVVVAGALGSMAPVLTSIATFVGNRRFSINWLWWYVLRAPIGVALAVLFYFIIRGGLLLPTVSTNPSPFAQDVTVALNIYGIAAFSALAGMFSKQATDKLEEVFNAVFTRKDPVSRNDPATGNPALVLDPKKLTKGTRQDLKVTGGSGFKQGASKATIDGEPRDFTVSNATSGTLVTIDKDVANVGKLKIAIATDGKTLKGEVDVA